jgi:hypothetical protein
MLKSARSWFFAVTGNEWTRGSKRIEEINAGHSNNSVHSVCGPG